MQKPLNAKTTGGSEAAPRVAVYARVSTGRQAEHDLSIPDQVAQISAWCAARGSVAVAQYIEPGASATDDKRPEFQRMIERACDGERAFDLIVVHSYSRFFRDAFGLEFYVRKLAKHNVKLVSITQELGEDPAQVMMRQVIALFDEYQSKENAKHVMRALKENARQGFWNGSTPPYGFKTIEAGKRGARIKKKLDVDPVEAETVRLVFRLFLEGDKGSGPMGVKSIVVWLNRNGFRTRLGALWGVGPIHRMLTSEVYVGVLRFNRKNTKTGQAKNEGEQVVTEMPAIITRETFDAVQTTLRLRNPRTTPPRVITGPILLTGLAYCACGGAMTLRTGTSKSGKVHRYYTCSSCNRHGKTLCKGRSVKMDRLDEVVTDTVATKLLNPDRLAGMLAALAEKRAEAAATVDARVEKLEQEAQQAQDRLTRLYRMVEEGIAEMDDLLRERISSLKAERQRATEALDRIRLSSRPQFRISRELIERFAVAMREKLTQGEIPFRKAYLGSVVDRVEVHDGLIRVMGRNDALEKAVTSEGGGGDQGVRSFVRNWRRGRDSNPRYGYPYSGFRDRPIQPL
jgi:site-specific DNA recombinase